MQCIEVMEMLPVNEWTHEEWEELFLFYNRMAARCYADAGAVPEVSKELPGARVMHQSEGRFGYHDMWYVGTTGDLGTSSGHSLLTVDDVPTWVFQYWGWYDKNDERVIPVLKEALLTGYTTGTSRGGRGPDMFFSEDHIYTYENVINWGEGIILPEHFRAKPRLKDGRLNFSGFERIYRKKEPTSSIPAFEVFRHELAGFALIN